MDHTSLKVPYFSQWETPDMTLPILSERGIGAASGSALAQFGCGNDRGVCPLAGQCLRHGVPEDDSCRPW